MTVKELIRQLSEYDQDKIVVVTEPDGVGWDNIGNVFQDLSVVKIRMDDNNPFNS